MMKSFRKMIQGLILSLTCLGLGGCTLPAPQISVSPAENEFLPTEIAQTIQAVVPTTTPSGEREVDLQPIPETNTPVPTLTATAESPVEELDNENAPVMIEAGAPVPLPPQSPAAIQILSPGPASKVISPIRLNAYLTPGDKGNVRIELFGEDGRVLTRKVLAYTTPTRLQVVTELDFEISAAGELGRLTISTADQEGREIAVASIDLLLLSLGEADITPSADRLDRIIIQEPAPKTLIQGGNLRVSGFIRPSGETLTWVELIGADNKVVGYRLLTVAEPQETGHTPFSVDVPYSVSDTSWVRLSISQRDGRIPGIINLSSRELLLSP